MAKKQTTPKTVSVIKHDDATVKNIQSLVRVSYIRRNRDLDPQLMWLRKANG